MTKKKTAAERPRVLIEDWLPAAAIGVECIRERSTGQQPPDKRLHVWWARRPLTAARAAVLASLLPADFPRDKFERLLGFGRPGAELVAVRRMMDTGYQVPGGFNADRAFKGRLREDDLEAAHAAAKSLWGDDIAVIDPMAGGGSIPLEAARLGFRSLANEYNPVACSVLEATVDYPFRFGAPLAEKTRKWGRVWIERVEKRLAPFFPKRRDGLVHAYIFARTVPCPETQHPTPLVPDWHLQKGDGAQTVAEPVVDNAKGTWKVRVRELGRGAGQVAKPPAPTYGGGKGVSLFTGRQISADYINAKAQAGEMGSALYAVAVKTPQGLRFQPAEPADLKAIEAAEKELARLRVDWEKRNLIPTERIPSGDKTEEPIAKGMQAWAELFSPRQLLGFGVLAEALHGLRSEVVAKEGTAQGEAVIHLLAFAIDKFANYNSIICSWHVSHQIMRSVFDRHDFSFKSQWAEMAPCGAGSGFDWALSSVIDAFDAVAALPIHPLKIPVEICLGSAINLPNLNDGSMTAVVVDPPYADNVQYSELADFFYVWLKRTQGHRRPEWFSTYLCEHDQEAVVNISRHREGPKSKRGARDGSAKNAREKANAFYQRLMTDTFAESRRVLRDDGVLTVMFTHKKQEAWEALFSSLVAAGFTITATWPVKTESEHSLNQAKKNAAQSTVILVARKRPKAAGFGYWDATLKAQIGEAARSTAARLAKEGLNPVDQLVGSFGPAMEVYSRFDEVRTDTGQKIGVSAAIDEASDAVSAWRIQQLAERGLDGVEPEGRFALLCWDVLGAAEFRFNEAKLLGHAVGMDVGQLETAGLVSKTGDKVKMLSARDRRRDRALEPDEVTETLFGAVLSAKKRTKKDALKVHPNDPQFRTAIDACHALALRYLESKGGNAGIGSARSLVRQQRWTKDSNVARLMEALMHAAPQAVRFEKGKTSAAALYPEFRAWHALLEPLFGIAAPEWKKPEAPQSDLFAAEPEAEYGDDEDEDAEEGSDD